MTPTSLRLEDLLTPTSVEHFLHETWEKQPLVVARGNAGHYGDLLSLRDIDNVIAFSRPKFADQSAFQGAAIPQPSYVRGVLADQPAAPPVTNPGLADLRQVFDQGKSVVLMGMQQRWPTIARLCRNLEGVFHCPVHANMYLTPPGSQGFAAHYDPHEVFILQLDGVKQWRIYDRAELLPLASEKVGIPKLPLGPSREIRLEAGDLLYIPRGHVHEAFTADAYSLHLTVGINVYRWSDLLQHALTSASRMDPRLRRSIPGGSLPGDTAGLREEFKRLLVALSESLPGDQLFDQGLASLGNQFLGQLQMLPGTQFGATVDLTQVNLGTSLEKDPDAICHVVENDNGAVIEFPGNRVGGPVRIAPILHFVAKNTRFLVREFPDVLNDRSKVVLARRLVREGLLSVVPPARRSAPPPYVAGGIKDHECDANVEEAVSLSEMEIAEAAHQMQ